MPLGELRRTEHVTKPAMRLQHKAELRCFIGKTEIYDASRELRLFT